MLSPHSHLALLALLLGTAQQADAHRYRTHGHHHGRRLFKPSPTFLSNEMAGAFRPFHNTYPSGGGIFTSAGPLVDVFQEVLRDITKASRHLSDSVAATARAPPHEVVETSEAAIITADLPGCKKGDVDAQISEEGGSKTLTITAVRKKPVLAATGNPEPPSSTDVSERNESAADPSETAEATAAVAATASPSETVDAKEDSPESCAPPSSPSFTEESFELSFSVGDGIDVSAIRGSLEDGVLTLVLPKLAPEPPAEPIEIPIDFAAGKLNSNRNANGVGPGQGRVAAEGTGSSPADADTHISLS